MKNNNYSSIINVFGLLALVLGVLLSVNTVRANLDIYSSEKANITQQFEQGEEMIQTTIDYKNGINVEELSPEDLAYVATLSDSTIAMYTESLADDYAMSIKQVKANMWDGMFAEAGSPLLMILVGFALIFVSKAISSITEQINTKQ